MRSRASGALEGVASKRWRRLERVAQTLRSLGDTSMTGTGRPVVPRPRQGPYTAMPLS